MIRSFKNVSINNNSCKYNNKMVVSSIVVLLFFIFNLIDEGYSEYCDRII